MHRRNTARAVIARSNDGLVRPSITGGYMTGERKSKTLMRDKQIPDSSRRTVALRLGGLGSHVASLPASRRRRGPVALRLQLSLSLPLAILPSFIACLPWLRNKTAIADFSNDAGDVSWPAHLAKTVRVRREVWPLRGKNFRQVIEYLLAQRGRRLRHALLCNHPVQGVLPGLTG